MSSVMFFITLFVISLSLLFFSKLLQSFANNVVIFVALYCLCACVYVYMCGHMYLFVYACVCARVCMHVYMCACNMYECVSVYLCARACVCVC